MKRVAFLLGLFASALAEAADWLPSFINSMIYVGTDAGIIYALSYPLP